MRCAPVYLSGSSRSESVIEGETEVVIPGIEKGLLAANNCMINADQSMDNG